jgi:hypothetical protein
MKMGEQGNEHHKTIGLCIGIDGDRRLDGVFAGEGKRICRPVRSLEKRRNSMR